MANSSFETFKQGGQAIDDAAQKTGQQAEGVYGQAKSAASDAYDSASEFAGDAVGRVQDGAAELDEMVSEQVDFIHVEDAAVRFGEEARFKDTLAVGDGSLEIERAEEALFGCADG